MIFTDIVQESIDRGHSIEAVQMFQGRTKIRQSPFDILSLTIGLAAPEA